MRLLGQEKCHLGWQAFSGASSPGQHFLELLRRENTRTHDSYTRDAITASDLEFGTPASSNRHKSRRIGTELSESPVFLELKPHWLAPSELNGFCLCQGLNTGNRRQGRYAHLHKGLQSPFSSAVVYPRASTATPVAENAAPILREDGLHCAKRDGPGLHS